MVFAGGQVAGTSRARDRPAITRAVVLVRLKLWSSPAAKLLGHFSVDVPSSPCTCRRSIPRIEREQMTPLPPRPLAFLTANRPCPTVTRDRFVLVEDQHGLTQLSRPVRLEIDQFLSDSRSVVVGDELDAQIA